MHQWVRRGTFDDDDERRRESAQVPTCFSNSSTFSASSPASDLVTTLNASPPCCLQGATAAMGVSFDEHQRTCQPSGWGGGGYSPGIRCSAVTHLNLARALPGGTEHAGVPNRPSRLIGAADVLWSMAGRRRCAQVGAVSNSLKFLSKEGTGGPCDALQMLSPHRMLSPQFCEHAMTRCCRWGKSTSPPDVRHHQHSGLSEGGDGSCSGRSGRNWGGPRQAVDCIAGWRTRLYRCRPHSPHSPHSPQHVPAASACEAAGGWHRRDCYSSGRGALWTLQRAAWRAATSTQWASTGRASLQAEGGCSQFAD